MNIPVLAASDKAEASYYANTFRHVSTCSLQVKYHTLSFPHKESQENISISNPLQVIAEHSPHI